MSKVLKRLLSGIFILLFLLIVAAVAIPYFYKDEILSILKEDLNNSLDATVDFTDVDLTLFRSFPDLYFSLDDLSIIGKGDFHKVPLLKSKSVGFSLDLMSVIKEELDFQIHEIKLDQPEVKIVINSDGTANYNVLTNYAQSDNESTQSSSSGFKMELDNYAISDGKLVYNDLANNFFFAASDLNHSGKGNFTESKFDLNTVTELKRLMVKSGGMTYLSNDELDADLIVSIDTESGLYLIKENSIKLNNLSLQSQGSIQTKGTGYDLDISIKAPGNEFKELLSILPGAYTEQYDQVQASGKFVLDSKLKGTYDGEKNKYPNIDLTLAINQGAFKYPGMSSGLEKMETSLKVNGNLGNLDLLKIDAEKFNFQIDQEQFTSNFTLRQIESNPAIKGMLNGKIDLGFIGKNFPLEAVTELSGFVNTNLKIDTDFNKIENSAVDEINLSGSAQIDNVVYQAENQPKFSLNTADVIFTPKSVNITSLAGEYGNSDFKGSGQIDNFLAVILPSKTMKGSFEIDSKLMDINEILGEGQTEVAGNDEVEVTGDEAVFDRFDFLVKTNIQSLKYDVYPISDFKFEGRVQPNKIEITKTLGLLGTSDFAAKGNLNNIFNYLYNQGEVDGTLDIGSKKFDLNNFMTFGEDPKAVAKATAEEEDFQAVILPERTNITINAKVNELIYTDLDFSKVKGAIVLKDQIATLKDCQMNSMGGSMEIDGNYDTKDKDNPIFDLKYGMKKVDFGQVFSSFVSWEKIAPLGKFLNGNFNTDLSFSGNLKDGYTPDLSTITADGFMQTINATLKAFPPIEKVANTLKLEEFKSLQIKNTKNWFEIKDGLMIVKDFDMKYKGIDMIVGGSHSLTQDMDYKIKAKIPRSMIQNNKVGQLANQGLHFLEEKAAKAGFNLDQGEFVNVLLNVGGSISKPTIKVNILGTDGTSSIKDQVVNTVKETVKVKVDSVKTVVTEKVDNEKAKLKAKMDKEVDAIMSLAKKQSDQIRKAGDTAAEKARDLGYAQADKLVKEAGNNFLKKKAAELASNKIKKETDKKVDNIKQKADEKADQVMSLAEKKALDVKKKYAAY